MLRPPLALASLAPLALAGLALTPRPLRAPFPLPSGASERADQATEDSSTEGPPTAPLSGQIVYAQDAVPGIVTIDVQRMQPDDAPTFTPEATTLHDFTRRASFTSGNIVPFDRRVVVPHEEATRDGNTLAFTWHIDDLPLDDYTVTYAREAQQAAHLDAKGLMLKADLSLNRDVELSFVDAITGAPLDAANVAWLDWVGPPPAADLPKLERSRSGSRITDAGRSFEGLHADGFLVGLLLPGYAEGAQWVASTRSPQTLAVWPSFEVRVTLEAPAAWWEGRGPEGVRELLGRLTLTSDGRALRPRKLEVLAANIGNGLEPPEEPRQLGFQVWGLDFPAPTPLVEPAFAAPDGLRIEVPAWPGSNAELTLVPDF